jgi:hypothetical protein
MDCPVIPTIQCQLNCPYRECKKLITADEMRLSDQIENDINSDPLPDDRRARWVRINPERNKANKHRHYIENDDTYKARRTAYYQANKEEILAKRHEYYQQNKELINARDRDKKRERWAEDPEYYRQKQRDYRARKRAKKMAKLGC